MPFSIYLLKCCIRSCKHTEETYSSAPVVVEGDHSLFLSCSLHIAPYAVHMDWRLPAGSMAKLAVRPIAAHSLGALLREFFLPMSMCRCFEAWLDPIYGRRRVYTLGASREGVLNLVFDPTRQQNDGSGCELER